MRIDDLTYINNLLEENEKIKKAEYKNASKALYNKMEELNVRIEDSHLVSYEKELRDSKYEEWDKAHSAWLAFANKDWN